MAGDIAFVTVDPGHFHAALVQKEMYPEIAPRAQVFAPLGPDLLAHLERLAGFNRRADRPTAWELDIHTGADFARQAFRRPPGNVIILAGFNARKIDYICQAVDAGMHVLADKPWIIAPAHLPRLQEVLARAEHNGLIAYDIMTERSEITSILQRELVNDAAIFGAPLPGTPEEPGVYMDSVHFLKKLVAGVPLRRPAWYFDIAQQGEGLSDVGTHLADLAMWILLPDRAVDAARDIQLLWARRWPTVVTRDDFRQITGQPDFPDFLQGRLDGGRLPYFCNNRVSYTLAGIHVVLNVAWGMEAEPGGGDTHMARFRGTRSIIAIRQGKQENFKSELFVTPVPGVDLRAALDKKVASWQSSHAGVALAPDGAGFHIVVPDRFRIGHEAHFAAVVRRFLRYVTRQEPLPAWENANMLAKYQVTTRGVALAMGAAGLRE